MPRHPRLSSGARIRTGLVLWLASWFPVAVLVGADGALRAAIWTVQILIGMLGLALLGTVFVAAVKGVGWRRTPAILWRALLHGDAGLGLS